MRKYHLIALAGILFVAAGFVLMAQPNVLAQEGGEPPYLAEYYNAWVESPHANAEAAAFTHWNDEGEIPPECAKCHSTPGYLDYLGADGSEYRVVDAPAPLGTVVTCDACHASQARDLTSVMFPSGVEVGVEQGVRSARCMECHQGRASGDGVNAVLAERGLTEDLNRVDPELGFINIHYYAAAATLYGGTVRSGYQFEGVIYQGRNYHVPGYQTCADCHDPHTTELQLDQCATCHEDVESHDDLRDIRAQSSGNDYDGDGDTDEGIYYEIVGLQEMLYGALQTYAREVAGTPIIYSADAYPYFFIDTNDNGAVDEGEAAFPNRYNAFTGNLLTAAYNYQVTQKDPGGFAHNPLYMIQLLYDAIAMLNGNISTPVDLAFAARTDPGHYDVTAEAFRHWDEEGQVPGNCARCHSAEGLPVFFANGSNIAEPIANSLACNTCHTSLTEFTIYQFSEVTFPSGARLSFGEEDESNLCLACHQGRESTVSVNAAIARAGVGDDEVADALSFRNIHYFAAGASIFGSEARGAYQYEGREYNGRNLHAEDAPNTCTGCHRTHEGTVRINRCEDCHDGVDSLEAVLLIRTEPEGMDPIDYDGDGNATEPIREEIMTLEDALYAAIQTYASEVVGTSIAYNPNAYPYWFIDTNGSGVADAEEVNFDNRYVTWTPTLLRAAYNYQYAQKDPGDFAHNPDYILQILYDAIEAIGGDVSAYTRPPVVSGE